MKACLLCVLIGGSGVGYVWQKGQINQLDQAFKKRETRLSHLQEQNRRLREQLAAMRSPRYLEMRITELNLGLAIPQPSQVLRLPEPAGEPPKTGDQQLVSNVARRPAPQ